ncbi:MAG: phenylacetate--CoA ligase [Clostridia bacterium]|nr:phenylacetate--CoA ligase [Clostridia bacterium]
MAYWQPQIETMPREDLVRLQSERLVKQVRRMYEKVECFRKRMDEKGLTPDDVKGVEDLKKLPFSYKQDLRDYYPYGLFAVPMDEIVRVHASSGTTGKKIVVGYTKNDLADWSDCMARQLYAAGADSKSLVQISYGYGLFTGGLGAHGGAERIGATVIPTSSGNTANQIQTMVDFGTTVLCCTPSYAMYLGEAVEEAGVKDKLNLKAGIFGAEPWTEEMRKSIEEKLGLKAFDVYGLSEIMGPGVSYECECQQGMHVCEDMFIPEIIDPDTEEVLPVGASGELVFTSIKKEGFPLIRYRTRDICSLSLEPCMCGRTHIRMNKPRGRSDDMLINRGVNVFPSQIEEVLLRLSNGAITPNYQIIVDRVNNNDTFDVNVEMSEESFTDDVKSIEAFEKHITNELRSVLGIGAKVHLVNPKTIVRSEGKAKRVIDKRKLF